MDVAVEALALCLEALEDALRDIERLAVAVRLGLDAGAEQIRNARFDVLRDELQLLQAAIGPLRLLVEIAFGRSTRLRLGHPLVGARELLDLLARAPDIASQHVDQSVELRFEVVRFFDESRRLWRRARSIWTRSRKTGDHRVSAWSFQQHRERILGDDPPALLPQRRHQRAIGAEEHLSDLVSVENVLPSRSQLDRLASFGEDIRQEWEEAAVNEHRPLRGAPDQVAAPVVFVQ